MSKLKIDFSFKANSPVKGRSQSTSYISLPQGLNHSQINMNNTSRFQEKKVLRKLKEQQLLNRIQSTLTRFNENEKLAREALKFKPVRKNKCEKQN